MDFLNEHRNLLVATIMLGPTLYLWQKLRKTQSALKSELDSQDLFYQRHNCIIMYSRKYIRGWPPETIKINTDNLSSFLEPYLYFIKTANRSLNIAVMVIAIDKLLEALNEAIGRGVKIRLIVNFQSVKSMSRKYNKLIKAGVQIAFYIAKDNDLSQIMHFKYMLKDCDGSNGFLCMGSMNFSSMSAILNNFEDVVFTSNPYLVDPFQKSFQDSWDMIRSDNENIFNKSVLADAGFNLIN